MATVEFTSSLARHISCPKLNVDAKTVSEALELVFQEHSQLRGYVLDEQGVPRHHVVVFLNGQPVHDRVSMLDSVTPEDEIFVFQALSGG